MMISFGCCEVWETRSVFQYRFTPPPCRLNS